MAPRSTKKDIEAEGQAKLEFSNVHVGSPPKPEFYTVSQVTNLLEGAINKHPVLGGNVVVRGELSNVKKSARGHIYYTLKDGHASLSGIVWASTAIRLKYDLDDGLEVFVTGKLEIYKPSGTYSIVSSKIEPVGVGALQLAFLQTKARLEAEGLFSEEFKQELPDFPLRIGIVTSNTGAVIHDMLRVIRRKNPLVDVLVAPAKVQGEGACNDIAGAITELNHPSYGLDLIIVARGGGSFEDLFCFSEEATVRAIFNSEVPIITGIGHEPDYSLADAVADYSAATPTGAAEWAVPDIADLREAHTERAQELLSGMMNMLLECEQRIDMGSTRLIEQFDFKLQALQQHVSRQQERFVAQGDLLLERQTQRITHWAASLDAFNPLKILARGYAIPAGPDGKTIHSVTQVQAGDALKLRLSDGVIETKISKIEKQEQ